MKKSRNKIHYYNFGKFRLDVSNRELLKDGKHVPLTQKSFELLEFLIENRGRGLRKNEILNDIWTESFVEEANLAQHVYMVRKALKDNGDSETFIETIPKYGYRFIGEVETEYGDQAGIQAAQKERLTKSDNSTIASNLEPAPLANAPSTEIKESDNQPPDSKTPKKPTGYGKWILFAVGLVTLILLGRYLWLNQSVGVPESSEIKSIAILPFSQIGSDPDQKLGLGIADTLISKLGNQNQISVSPTSTIIKFIEKGTDNPIEIGEKLEVDAVLTGTIQRENDTVRVNVQMISVKEKTPKWSDRFDAKFSNIFSLQDHISEQVAERLSIKLGQSAELNQENKYTENIEAYQSYTMGLFFWDKRSQSNLPKAIKHFESAIEKDSNFSTAYALSADAYSLIGYYGLDEEPAKAIGKAREMANRALKLDPDSSEAHTALGIVALYDKKPKEAKRLYRKAIELKPNNPTARQRLAWMLTTNPTLEEAIAEMKLAQKADPLSLVTNLNLTRLLRLNRQPNEALTFCKLATEMDPSSDSAKVFLAEIHEQNGDFQKAISELEGVLERDPSDFSSKLILSRIHAKNNDKNKSRELLTESLSDKNISSSSSSYELATVYLALGEKDESIKTLKAAKERSLIYLLHLKYDPNLDEVRKSAEYARILKSAEDRLDPSYK